MSIRNKSKDNRVDRSALELVVAPVAPLNADPLLFWTGHPTENSLVNLRPFATGEADTGKRALNSPPPDYSGRPQLILELAPALQARLALYTESTCISYLSALRKFWRTCDELEAETANGLTVDRLVSVHGLTHLHEAAMHRRFDDRVTFGIILNLFNDARILLRLRPLLWTAPKRGEPSRILTPDSHAKAIKIAVKRDWQRVRKTWERNDAIMRGEEPSALNDHEQIDENIVREYAEKIHSDRKNWEYFERIQRLTGNILPSSSQLYEKRTKFALKGKGLYVSQMRAIAFPHAKEAHIAFHAALIRSGWNPSTLIAGLDATMPDLIFQHPKAATQQVLTVDVDDSDDQSELSDADEFSMQGSKRRAGGRIQFCMGLKKDPDSPPSIVAAFLERTASLRKLLQLQVLAADEQYRKLKAEAAPEDEINRQFRVVQTLLQGTRNVWLYVDYRGQINWLNGTVWRAFHTEDGKTRKHQFSYLQLVVRRLNEQRLARKQQIREASKSARTELELHLKTARPPHQMDPENSQAFMQRKSELIDRALTLDKTLAAMSPEIASITPSDLRDIYARWVYVQTGGNVIAVMIALGHARLMSTDAYVTNNIFSAESDNAVRTFMTHLFQELERGRVDLTILTQLVRHGPLTAELEARLLEIRSLTRSRVQVGCTDIRNPPQAIMPTHTNSAYCGTHRCLRDCPNARFLPESVDGIAMRVEELVVLSESLSQNEWVDGKFEAELETGEYLLANLYARSDSDKAREHWRKKIQSGLHAVEDIGFVRQ